MYLKVFNFGGGGGGLCIMAYKKQWYIQCNPHSLRLIFIMRIDYIVFFIIVDYYEK